MRLGDRDGLSLCLGALPIGPRGRGVDRDVSDSPASQGRQPRCGSRPPGVKARVLTKPAVGKEAADTQGGAPLGRWPAIPQLGEV